MKSNPTTFSNILAVGSLPNVPLCSLEGEKMTHNQALYYLQDESYPFQCLEDELMEIETSGDIFGISQRAKEIYSLMEKMITDFQKTGQWPLF